jgi:hypothetical protein
MDVPEVKELKSQDPVLINEAKPRKCTMCKFVLVFAFAALLLVLVFSFFYST